MPPPKPAGRDGMEWSEHLAGVIKEKFGLGEGPDVVLEVTGAEPCIQTGVHPTKKGGTFVQAGMGTEVRIHNFRYFFFLCHSDMKSRVD